MVRQSGIEAFGAEAEREPAPKARQPVQLAVVHVHGRPRQELDNVRDHVRWNECVAPTSTWSCTLGGSENHLRAVFFSGATRPIFELRAHRKQSFGS